VKFSAVSSTDPWWEIQPVPFTATTSASQGERERLRWMLDGLRQRSGLFGASPVHSAAYETAASRASPSRSSLCEPRRSGDAAYGAL
jgi:hypothetical protein